MGFMKDGEFIFFYRGSEDMATKRLDEKPFGFDYITTQFYNNFVIIGNEKIPLGQISTEILNLSDEQMDELSDILLDLKNAFLEKLYGEYNSSLIVLSHHSFGAFLPYFEKAIDALLELPLFNRINFDKKQYIYDFKEIYATYPKERGRDTLNRVLVSLLSIHDEILIFRIYAIALADGYLERLKLRNSNGYAHALYQFLSDDDMQKELECFLPKYPVVTFKVEMPAHIEYVTRPDPGDVENYIIAERIVFNSIGSFLNSDLFKAMTVGHAPRKCHNCGRYFLHLGGSVCYCNEIAPNDPKGRTCRKVGPHKKEQSKENKSPAELEYKRAYERLKKRKNSSPNPDFDKWNAQVAYARDILDQARQGKISDIDAVTLLKSI